LPESFVLARGSPFDSVGLSRTAMSYMACRRSGVRIPLTPQVFRVSVRKTVTNIVTTVDAPESPVMASKFLSFASFAL
jgi:hypothetical protein